MSDSNRPEDTNRGTTGRDGDAPGTVTPGSSAGGTDDAGRREQQPGAGGASSAPGTGSSAEGSGEESSSGSSRTPDPSASEGSGGAGETDRKAQEGSSSGEGRTSTGSETASGSGSEASGASGEGSGDGAATGGGSGGSRLSSTPEPRSRFSLWFVIVLLAGAIAAVGGGAYHIYEELEEIAAAEDERQAAFEDALERVERQAEAAERLEGHLEDIEAQSEALAELESRVEATSGSVADVEDRMEETSSGVAELRERIDGWEQRLEELEAGAGEGVALDEAEERFEARIEERVAELEDRLADRIEELASAQATLEDDLDELGARTGEEAGWLKAEAGYLAQVAIHRVRYHRDIDSALAALRGADSLLAELGGEGIPERQAIQEAVDELLAYSGPDISGLRGRITARLDAIDELPVRGDPDEAVAPELPELEEEADEGWQQALARAWARLREGLGELIRVQREEEMEQLVSPDQRYLVRENLRLQLEGVLLALANGDTESYSDGLNRAADWLDRHFDTDDPDVAEARDELRQLADEPITHDVPDIEPVLEPVKPF